jgi:hypothetical protein
VVKYVIATFGETKDVVVKYLTTVHEDIQGCAALGKNGTWTEYTSIQILFN